MEGASVRVLPLSDLRAALDDALSGTRFLAGLPGYLRHPVSLGEAKTSIQQRLEHREADLLALARRAIYGYPRSPFLSLLRWAGCEYGDLQALVSDEGVEPALSFLYRQGVYLTVDEARGRRPVVRGGVALDIDPDRLLNPLLGRYLVGWGGGSRGQGRPVAFDLMDYRERAVTIRLMLEARGATDWSHAVWGVPGGWGLSHVLEYAAAGAPPVRWFSPVDPAASGLHARYRWSARLLQWGGTVAGVPLPGLEYVPLEDLAPILNWVQSVLRAGGTPHVATLVSPAVRLCEAATQAGIDLTGAQFTVGGEPSTPGRIAVIRRCGAEVVPSYGSTEASPIGKGCLSPLASDDLHLFHDCVAVIQPGEAARGAELPADVLLLTSLRPTARFVLLNVSLGDSAVLTRRPCGCAMEALGWTTHLHSVRSFEKLTAGGMAFLDTDVIEVLERLLPARFGGGPTDYQLVEEESEGCQVWVRLLVHPRLGPIDEEAVADAFMQAIGRGSGAQRVMELMWREAGILRVERELPGVTADGKILHLHRQPAPV